MAELPNDQINRLEQYLNYLATGSGDIPSEPQNRLEQYLEYLCENGGGGGGLPDPTLLPAGSVLVGDGVDWTPQDGYGYTGKQLKAETIGYGPEITTPPPPHPELTYKALYMPNGVTTSLNFTPASVVYNWDGSEHPFTYDDTLGYYRFDEGFIYVGIGQFAFGTNVYVQENVLPEDESARTVKVYENVLHQIDVKYVPGAKQMFSMSIVNMMGPYIITFPDAPNFIRAVNAAGNDWTNKVGIYSAISIGDGGFAPGSFLNTINVALLLQLQSGDPVVYLFNMTRDPDAPNFHQIGKFKMSDVLPTAGVNGTGVVSVGSKWFPQTGYAINMEIPMDVSTSKLDPEGEYTPFQMSNLGLGYTPSSIKYSWDNSVHPLTLNPETGAWEFDNGFIEIFDLSSRPFRVMVRTSVIPSWVFEPSVQVQQKIVQKFDPDLLPDDATHRFVTDNEKAAWNAKQDSIDLKAFVFAMPRKIYLGPSTQDAIKLYFDSMIPQRYTPRVGNYTAICEMRLTEDYLKMVPGTTGTKGIDSYVYDERMNLIASHSNTDHYYDVVVSSDVPGPQTMLLLGDSFIEQGYIAPDLRGLFTADGVTLTLVGTKGSGADKHEGYAGKSAIDFANGFSGSPFGESSFDFASYMTSHGYTIDSAYIQLGTNDVSAGSIMSDAQIAAVISAFDTIVGAIHTYSSAIKVVLGTPVGCTADTAKFSEAYYGTGEREIMQQNMRKLSAAIIDHFADVANVRVAPVVGILDPTEDFHNSVHPNAGGYAKMAKCVYDTMRGF